MMPAGSTRRGFLRTLSAAGFALLGVVTRAWSGVSGSPQRPVQQRPVQPRPAPPVAGVATAQQTVKLTDAAVQAPLPEKSWLNFFRNFMTRSGSWRGHPTESRMLARRAGRVAVLGPERAPVSEMLGIGNIKDDGGVVACATNVCDANSYAARSSCQSRSCGKNVCSDLECTIDQCSDQDCAKHSCEAHSAALSDIVGELQTNWETAFVRELRVQFGADSTTALAQAVTRFVQRNGYRTR